MTHHRSWIAAPLVLTGLLTILTIIGCSHDPTCTGTLHPYNGKCATNMAILYNDCMDGRGFNTVTDVGGEIGLKEVVELGGHYKDGHSEDPGVVKQIETSCLQIAKAGSAETDSERATADNIINGWVEDTPEITLSHDSAHGGEKITVKGIKFAKNEMIAVRVHATDVARTRADSNGAFSVVITIPTTPFDYDTDITAIGQTSARFAQAIFHWLS